MPCRVTLVLLIASSGSFAAPPKWVGMSDDLAREPVPSAINPVQIEPPAPTERSRGLELSGTQPAGSTPARYQAWSVEFESEQARRDFAVPGAAVFNGVDKWAQVFVPTDSPLQRLLMLREIRRSKGFVWYEEEVTIPAPPLPVPRRALEVSRGAPEKIVRGGVEGTTGEGTIIAIIDTGLDFRHPDFKTLNPDGDETSQLLYYWDVTDDTYDQRGEGRRPPMSYPNGASMGTLYGREELNVLVNSLPVGFADVNSHGTACAGVAAGNGRAANGQYTGVAPRADLIGVRIAKGNSITHAFLLPRICAWLDEVAGTRPLVVSCSFTDQSGPHDGQMISERLLRSIMPPDRSGRALCVAAANDRRHAIHAELDVSSKDIPAKLEWKVTDEKCTISIYMDSAEAGQVSFDDAAEPKQRNSYVNPITHQLVREFVYSREAASELGFVSVDGQTHHLDAYIYDGEFEGACVSRRALVGSPGSIRTAITVGSYDWNNLFETPTGAVSLLATSGDPLTLGALSQYSSPGPLRPDSLLKPEIVAPGQWFTAPLSTDILTSGRGRFMVDRTDEYRAFNGTSAACPYTAGVIALMFQKNPTLTMNQIKDLFRQHATHDEFTTAGPAEAWGYGKLDYDAVVRILRTIH